MTAPAATPVEQAPDFSGYRGIWVYVQHRWGEAAAVSWQLIGIAKQLAAELDVPVGAVVLGSGVRHLCDDAIAFGADAAYLIDDPVLKDYRTQPYAHAVANLILRYKPEIV